MNIVGKDKLHDFKSAHPDACSHIDAWVAEVEDVAWSTPQDVKARYPKASILPRNQVVFNIRGNRYRLLVRASYKNNVVVVTNVGTHQEYMKWDTTK